MLKHLAVIMFDSCDFLSHLVFLQLGDFSNTNNSSCEDYFPVHRLHKAGGRSEACHVTQTELP